MVLFKHSGDIYIVSVDSRGAKSTSDLDSYKEHVCSLDFFEEHIHQNPKNICVKSQVAGLCGLDLKIYFRKKEDVEWSKFSNTINDENTNKNHANDVYKSLRRRTNGIATMLTFNPSTGFCNQVIQGKAYILLNNGTKPISKEQVWRIHEFIKDAKKLYRDEAVDGFYSRNAEMELLTLAAQYQVGTWAPNQIYESRDDAHHTSNGRPARHTICRRESGMSDEATCHHGVTHEHHKGEHSRCRVRFEGSDDELYKHETRRAASTRTPSDPPAYHGRNYRFYQATSTNYH